MSMRHAVIRRQSFLQSRFASERACGSLSNTSNVPKGQLQYAPLSRASTCTKEVLFEEPLSAYWIADAAELSARPAFPVPGSASYATRQRNTFPKRTVERTWV